MVWGGGVPTLFFRESTSFLRLSSTFARYYLGTKVGHFSNGSPPETKCGLKNGLKMIFVISGILWVGESISAILKSFRVMVATQSRVKAVCLKISISKYNHVTYLFIGFWGRWTHFWHLYGYLADVGRPSTWSLSLTWPNSTTRRGIIIFHVYSLALPSCRASPWCQVSPMEFHLLWLELALSL